MEEFHLEGKEFIELDNLLKVMGLSRSGGSAKTVIAADRVMVDGQVEFRRRCKIRAGQMVEFEDRKIVISE